MGWMKLLEATIKTITLPIKAACDILDPDVIFDEKKSRTRETMEAIVEDIDDIAE